MTDQHEPTYVPITGNQVVAYNLRMARLRRGWTQEEAAERLEPYLGVRWSKASYSAAERSIERQDRIRNFTADELLAFSLAFELPVAWFLLPPEPDVGGRMPLIAYPGAEEGRGHHPGVLIELVFGTPEGQAQLEQRLAEILRRLPLAEQGRYMELVSHVAGLAGLSAVRNTLGDLSVWIENLQDLTALLEQAQAQTTETMHEAIDRFVSAYSHPESEESDDDAGSR
ncbi:MAG: helix-turn-helix transcriptional regulator [Gaiellales bacterium]|nr:helix-turn-helix transcriptional regulator [Gaiellales bacterium]